MNFFNKGKDKVYIMKDYVLGFLFDINKQFVWLIEKNRPILQCGRLNGIGGKVEPNENHFDSMKREFKEEGGLDIKDWKWFCTFSDDENYNIFCYCSISDKSPKTMEDEKINCYIINLLPKNIMPNISWLIPMAISFLNGEIQEPILIKEKLNLCKLE